MRRVKRWLGQYGLAERPAVVIAGVGAASAVLLIAGFVSVAEDVLLGEDLAQIDRSVLGFIQEYRTALATVFFRWITNLAGVESVIAGLTVLLAVAWRSRFLPVLFGGAVVLGVMITQTLKLVFGRLRPEEALRVVAENGFSFPSGHTFLATVLFGLGGYVLARSAKTRLGRWSAASIAGLLVLLVGFSRMYLGVHYPSDVLASFFFASALVCVAVTFIEINQSRNLRPSLRLPDNPHKPLMAALGTMTLVAALGVVIA